MTVFFFFVYFTELESLRVSSGKSIVHLYSLYSMCVYSFPCRALKTEINSHASVIIILFRCIDQTSSRLVGRGTKHVIMLMTTTTNDV